ncbi:hypothetical protein PSAB6_450094 [Paraburkholderia sabiae]|nr:hypothetical protein PSAB6_450094 [Paraburkholderia sabiae]
MLLSPRALRSGHSFLMQGSTVSFDGHAT